MALEDIQKDRATAGVAGPGPIFASSAPRAEGETEITVDRVLPWESRNRGPLNTKLLELRGKYKDIFEALGGGDAFIAELRSDPEDPHS